MPNQLRRVLPHVGAITGRVKRTLPSPMRPAVKALQDDAGYGTMPLDGPDQPPGKGNLAAKLLPSAYHSDEDPMSGVRPIIDADGDDDAPAMGARAAESRRLSRLRSGRLTEELPGERPEGRPLSLLDRVNWVPGFVANQEAKLRKLDILSVYDLITHYPRSYSPRRRILELNRGEVQTVIGMVSDANSQLSRGRRIRVTEINIEDAGARLTLVFFNQPGLNRALPAGTWIKATGMVDFNYGRFAMTPSKWERIKPPADGMDAWAARGMDPDYPLTNGLSNFALQKLVSNALGRYGELLPEVLPKDLIESMRLMPLYEAMREIHQPRNDGFLQAARLSLKFREFYLLQAGLALNAKTRRGGDTSLEVKIDEATRDSIRATFPFEFTGAQERATEEILRDMGAPGRMNRLLQGDVGSGKTAVCLYAALAAVANGMQVAILAPTEILARQHFRNFSAMLGKRQERVSLLIGGMAKAERDHVLENLASGRTNIIVGTHALLEPKVKFRRLGLMVVDEQHKFGVRQRASLFDKGNKPHRLVMSATPIPRTLSMTIYGDLDLSIIDELPPGRKPVVTSWVPEESRNKCMAAIAQRLAKGDQAYFIDPLVEPNPDLEVKSALERYHELQREFGHFGVSLLHGQMSTDEKEAAMAKFNSGASKVLVATVVVEVGVDVPAANIMVINHSERFGLSQLHQLRGRIGRGGGEATLYLFGAPQTEEGVQRLSVLCQTTDGFAIAEADLKLRGFGDFMGTRQAGMPKLKIGDPIGDMKILGRAREEAFKRTTEADRPTVEQLLAYAFGRSFQMVDA